MHFADFLTLLSTTVLSKHVNINTCQKHVSMWGIVSYSSQGQKDAIDNFVNTLKFYFFIFKELKKILKDSSAWNLSKTFCLLVWQGRKSSWQKCDISKVHPPSMNEKYKMKHNISTKIVEMSVCPYIIIIYSLLGKYYHASVHMIILFLDVTSCCDRPQFSGPQLFSFRKKYQGINEILKIFWIFFSKQSSKLN